MAKPLTPRMRRLALGVAAAVTVATALATGPAAADTSPGPNNLPAPGPGQPKRACLPEQYPHAGAARASASVPYEIPFTASLGDPVHHTIGGGYLEISNGGLTFILGGPISLTDGSGSITATACGLVSLPSQVGGITGNPYGASVSGDGRDNNNFVFSNPITVSAGLPGIPGLPLLNASATAVGFLGASIDPTPAANGGLNVEFEASAKATAVLTVGALRGLANLLGPSVPAFLLALLAQLASLAPNVPLPGGECTVPIGNLLDSGVPSSDFGGVTKLGGAANTTPVHLTTRTSGTLTGQPVTGPITGAQAVLVSNDFPVAAIDPNTPPSPDAPGAGQSPSTLCTPSNASLFNTLLNLPSPAGHNIFYAPGTFAVFTSS